MGENTTSHMVQAKGGNVVFIEGFMLQCQCQLANSEDQIYDIFKCLPPDVQATIFCDLISDGAGYQWLLPSWQ